jgi:hypothetical protein
MSRLCFSSFNILDIHCNSLFNFNNFIFFWSCTFNIMNIHCISHKFWWSKWSLLNFSEIVYWVKWIMSRSFGLKFYTVRSSPFNVLWHEVILRLIQTNMQTGRVGPVNIPILIRKFGLVNLFWPMQFGRCTCNNHLIQWGNETYLGYH